MSPKALRIRFSRRWSSSVVRFKTYLGDSTVAPVQYLWKMQRTMNWRMAVLHTERHARRQMEAGSSKRAAICVRLGLQASVRPSISVQGTPCKCAFIVGMTHHVSPCYALSAIVGVTHHLSPCYASSGRDVMSLF